jgi:hypothetical protein
VPRCGTIAFAHILLQCPSKWILCRAQLKLPPQPKESDVSSKRVHIWIEP